MTPRRFRGRSLDDIYDLLDQIYVIATRTDGRLAGLIIQIGKTMKAEQEFEFRKAIQEVELSRMNLFVQKVSEREPEVATHMHTMFAYMQETEQWIAPKRSA